MSRKTLKDGSIVKSLEMDWGGCHFKFGPFDGCKIRVNFDDKVDAVHEMGFMLIPDGEAPLIHDLQLFERKDANP